ncbi:hypothetical protein HYT92_01695 [Candidatus Pacearchaeota archaeon]|nr:hypothetical protein [Candidatus Pacearchaeota archaeon]
MSQEKSMSEKILEQFIKESGWHTSRSDDNEHLTIKNSDRRVTGHLYKDGTIKGTNPWLLK